MTADQAAPYLFWCHAGTGPGQHSTSGTGLVRKYVWDPEIGQFYHTIRTHLESLVGLMFRWIISELVLRSQRPE